MSTQQRIPESLQDIFPKWAHFCLYIERFVKYDLDVDLKGKHLVVGLSGGVDSTALLMVLHYLSVRNDYRITAAHLNHGLRPEADDDAKWVQELCRELHIECIEEKIDIAALAQSDGIGIEEAGRNARYAFYKRIMKKHAADYIALGHQLDDLSEDVLMRFIRGTGWPGLAGMDGFDERRRLIRPLLMLPKSTLKAFVTHLGLQWREDATNAEPVAMRNRIRNDVLPLITRENPNFPDSVARLWRIGKTDQSYWNEKVAGITSTIRHKELEVCHKAERLRMYKSALDQLGSGQVLAATLFRLDQGWTEKEIGDTFQFPGNKIATITSEGIVFGFKD